MRRWGRPKRLGNWCLDTPDDVTDARNALLGGHLTEPMPAWYNSRPVTDPE